MRCWCRSGDFEDSLLDAGSNDGKLESCVHADAADPTLR